MCKALSIDLGLGLKCLLSDANTFVFNRFIPLALRKSMYSKHLWHVRYSVCKLQTSKSLKSSKEDKKLLCIHILQIVITYGSGKIIKEQKCYKNSEESDSFFFKERKF